MTAGELFYTYITTTPTDPRCPFELSDATYHKRCMLEYYPATPGSKVEAEEVIMSFASSAILLSRQHDLTNGDMTIMRVSFHVLHPFPA